MFGLFVGVLAAAAAWGINLAASMVVAGATKLVFDIFWWLRH
jgi:hypothetical protein